MSRYYIGVACTGHDNALAIVDPRGRVVFAEGTERYLQNKRAVSYVADDHHRTRRLIERFCPDATELVVAKTWGPNAEFILSKVHKGGLQALRSQESSDEASLRNWDYLLWLVRKSIRESGRAIRAVAPHCAITERSFPHHLTHAAAGCFSSSYTDALCAIVDGFGEGVDNSVYSFAERTLRPVQDDAGVRYSAGGLGWLYSDVTSLCGFSPWQGEEWKVMGLAAYGRRDPDIYALLEQCIEVDGLRFTQPSTHADAKAALAEKGRKPGSSAETVADLAHTCQAFFGDMMTQLLVNLHRRGNSNQLVLGGGCALNSSYTGQIVSRTPFESVHVFCAPADDGNAVGAAWLAYQQDRGAPPPESFQSPYLGSELSEESLERLTTFRGPLQMSTRSEDLTRTTAKRLAEGKIVAWVQGRAEFGPRALGNRSILADPRSAEMRDRINEVVKFREEFRPLAPSILHQYGNEYFHDYQESPYMERTLAFRDDVKGKVPAVVHADGTGRLQTVKREWNARYYDLITDFYDITGIPLVLNTSFNVMGKPIVHSVEDAVAVFLTSGIDVLVLGDRVFEK